MTVRRNAFGRQVDSFEGDIEFDGLDGPAHAVFIRAPWVERVGPEVQVLPAPTSTSSRCARAACWPPRSIPEMTGDRRVHKLFVDIVTGRGLIRIRRLTFT